MTVAFCKRSSDAPARVCMLTSSDGTGANTGVTVEDAPPLESLNAAETQSVELKRSLTWYCETLVRCFGFELPPMVS